MAVQACLDVKAYLIVREMSGGNSYLEGLGSLVLTSGLAQFCGLGYVLKRPSSKRWLAPLCLLLQLAALMSLVPIILIPSLWDLIPYLLAWKAPGVLAIVLHYIGEILGSRSKEPQALGGTPS